jgi:hypothetical protein
MTNLCNPWSMEISVMRSEGTLARKGRMVRFILTGGIALILIAACASVFSMLLWSPAVEPTAVAGYAVVSDQSLDTFRPTSPGNLRGSGGSRDRKILCSLTPAPTSRARWSTTCWTSITWKPIDKAGVHPRSFTPTIGQVGSSHGTVRIISPQKSGCSARMPSTSGTPCMKANCNGVQPSRLGTVGDPADPCQRTAPLDCPVTQRWAGLGREGTGRRWLAGHGYWWSDGMWPHREWCFHPPDCFENRRGGGGGGPGFLGPSPASARSRKTGRPCLL